MNSSQRMMDALPDYYQFSEIAASIQAAQGDEYDSVDQQNEDLRKQLYIVTATWGLKYWEGPLGIPIIESDSYDIRRSRVLAAWRGKGNFSAEMVKRVCEAFSNGGVDVYLPWSMTDLVFHKVEQPGGTADTFDEITGVFTDRAAVRILQASDIKNALAAGYPNADYLLITKPADCLKGRFLYACTLEGYVTVVGSNWSDGSLLGKCGHWDDTTLAVGFAKGTSFATAFAAMQGKKLTYQLTTPVDTQVNHKPYTLAIKFIGARGIPPNLDDLKAAVDNLIHAHLGAQYSFTFLTWDELDRAALTWDELDAMGLTWDEFEVWQPA